MSIAIQSMAQQKSALSVSVQMTLTFELRDVVAARRREVLSERSIGVDISVRYSTAFAEALRKDSATIVGCMPFCSIFSAAPKKLPARTTTDVVPSPASTSCAAERSTSFTGVSSQSVPQYVGRTIFAAGCSACMLFKIVAPSFVMTSSPLDVWI